jgi:hypothetical protein
MVQGVLSTFKGRVFGNNDGSWTLSKMQNLNNVFYQIDKKLSAK